MGWMLWIGKDTLTRMECIRAFAREQFLNFAAYRAWLRFGAGNFEQRQIVDRTGPGQFYVFEGWIFVRLGKLPPRHGQKHKVPEAGSDHCTPRDMPLNRTIPKKFAIQ